ncbi:MAG: hypothetical protein HC927_01605 [Deltaproteobacteria bacterium]|nr:hypothetical protein [Deltaproteobacteria bacterium]
MTIGKILKWLGIVLLGAAALFVIVGLFLPRDWHVERSVTITGSREQIHALVADPEQWERWMFDMDALPAETELSAEGQGVGGSVSWSGPAGRGQMTLTEADPQTGIRWDGKIETDEVNNHGKIEYRDLGDGQVEVTLTDEGTLPPVIGGYFVFVMNSALDTHFEAALGRLEHAVEAGG